MPKSPSVLQTRRLNPEEVASMNGHGKKVMVVDWLKRQFIDEATGQPIQVGQGIEIGPFDSETEGRNWLKYYLGEAVTAMGWGKEKTKGGHRIPPIAIDPISRDGQFFMWVVRVKD